MRLRRAPCAAIPALLWVPLDQQVIVGARCDELDLPVDPGNLPRFRLARLND